VRRVAHEVLPPLAGIAGVIVVWALVAAVTTTASIPTPLAVWDALIDGLRAGTIQEAALKTLIRLAFSFVVAVVIGAGLGVALALNEFLRRAVRPIIVALQITPFVAWVPLAIVWFGISERAVVFVTIVGAFPAMALATLQAIRQVPPLYERAGRTLGARGWTLYRRIVVPAALPGMMAGLQQAWGFAWKALMAGELIVVTAGATGLGHLLAGQEHDVTALLATLGVIVALGVAVDYLVFGQLDRRIRARRGLLPDA
jgi:NitT/TauT family transport system permease protein